MKRLALVVPLLAFLGLAVLLYSGIGKDPSILPSALVNRPAPEFALPDLIEPATIVSKEKLLGEPYLLNVWASWCAACQIEHPFLTELAESGTIAVYGLNWRDDRGDALRWLDYFGNPYAAIAHDPDNDVGIDFGVYGAPETFLISAEGDVLFKHVGPLTREVYDKQIKPILKESQG